MTFGAHDFGAFRDFYRRVGWPQVMDEGDFAVFELRGIVLALFPRSPSSPTAGTQSPSQAPKASASPSACSRQRRWRWPAQRAHACSRCSRYEGARRRGVLHRSVGLSVSSGDSVA